MFQLWILDSEFKLTRFQNENISLFTVQYGVPREWLMEKRIVIWRKVKSWYLQLLNQKRGERKVPIAGSRQQEH